MKRKLILWTLGAGLLLFGMCWPAFCDALAPFKGEKGTIRISGGTAHIPVMKAAAQQIMSACQEIQITIAGGGSGVGIKQAGEGLVEIGNSGRRPTEAEIARYGLKLHQWAVDGVAVVVNPKNPVRSLNGEQLSAIFAGTIDNWKAVGGEDARISLYTRDEASGTREVFWEKGLNKGAIAAGANVVVSNGAMKTAVAQDPAAIGYVSVGHIDSGVAAVAVEGVTPSVETVKDGRYTIARGLFSNTKGDPTGLTRKFIDFLFTPEGQTLVSAGGFIPVKK